MVRQRSNLLKISIITPSYNQGKYLEKTIESVISQSYPNWEYLIFDGGSTDNSVSIIKKYAHKYPQIKWVSKKDKGQVDAINNGLKVATGDIIAYINSDDYYLPQTFQKVVDNFQKNHCLWLVGDCGVTSSRLTWTFWLKHLWPVDKHEIFLKIFNTINQPAVFLSKQIIKDVGQFNEYYHYAFDYEYWLRCLRISLPCRLKSNLAVFRVHEDAKGSLAFKKQFTEDLEIAYTYTPNGFIRLIHKVGQLVTTLSYKQLK